jgi:hypothetical protein
MSFVLNDGQRKILSSILTQWKDQRVPCLLCDTAPATAIGMWAPNREGLKSLGSLDPSPRVYPACEPCILSHNSIGNFEKKIVDFEKKYRSPALM